MWCLLLLCVVLASAKEEELNRTRVLLLAFGAKLDPGLEPRFSTIANGFGLFYSNQATSQYLEVRIPAELTICARSAPALTRKVQSELRMGQASLFKDYFALLPQTIPSSFVLEWGEEKDLNELGEPMLIRRAKRKRKLYQRHKHEAFYSLARFWVYTRSFGVAGGPNKGKECLVPWVDFANHRECSKSFSSWNWLVDGKREYFQFRSKRLAPMHRGEEFFIRYDHERLSAERSLLEYAFVDKHSKEQRVRIGNARVLMQERISPIALYTSFKANSTAKEGACIDQAFATCLQRLAASPSNSPAPPLAWLKQPLARQYRVLKLKLIQTAQLCCARAREYLRCLPVQRHGLVFLKSCKSLS